MDDRDGTKSSSLTEKFLNWKSISLFWLAFTLLPCLLNSVTSRFSEWAVPFLYVVKTESINSAIWLSATPLVFLLARRLPFFGRRWLVNITAHLIIGIIVPVLQAMVFLLFYRPLVSREEVEFFDHLVILLDYHLYGGVLIYWFLLLVYNVLAYADHYRRSERTANRIREMFANSQLEILKARVQPHFLFNTLHTVGSLIRLDKKESALETLEDLGELLRQSLYEDKHRFTPLKDELLLIKRYLKIESRRFSDRLTVEYRIDPQVEMALVPSFLLQPLVENAIKHGVCSVPDAGRLEIIAHLDNDQLHLEVNDDGPGVSKSGHYDQSNGVGIKNTQERLRQLYGEKSTFVLKNRPVRGAAAIVILPFKRARP